MNASRRVRDFAIAAIVVLSVGIPASAYSTPGDLYAAGTAYRATTYRNHRSVFGGPEQWVVDINANGGDEGRGVYAPEAGVVTLFSTGWGDGYGTSVIWTSMDGREQIHIAHLSQVVKTGPVHGGELVAKAGNTGNSTGDHMHVSRAYDGKPAPLVLSGHEIVPSYVGPGTQYYSGGQFDGYIDVPGIANGMDYYHAVTLSFSCAEAEAGTLVCTLDGEQVASGTVVSGVGNHCASLSATIGGRTVARIVTFTIVSPPAPQLQPLFRFYNPGSGAHFYTPSDQERDSVVQQYSGVYAYEGVAYFMNPSANSQPLYRFYNTANGSHFYTASASERDAVKVRWPEVYRYEGETYAVMPGPTAGAREVYRFYNRRTGSHFYTASASEKDDVIRQWPYEYQYEGVAFWVAQ